MQHYNRNQSRDQEAASSQSYMSEKRDMNWDSQNYTQPSFGSQRRAEYNAENDRHGGLVGQFGGYDRLETIESHVYQAPHHNNAHNPITQPGFSHLDLIQSRAPNPENPINDPPVNPPTGKMCTRGQDTGYDPVNHEYPPKMSMENMSHYKHHEIKDRTKDPVSGWVGIGGRGKQDDKGKVQEYDKVYQRFYDQGREQDALGQMVSDQQTHHVQAMQTQIQRGDNVHNTAHNQWGYRGYGEQPVQNKDDFQALYGQKKMGIDPTQGVKDAYDLVTYNQQSNAGISIQNVDEVQRAAEHKMHSSEAMGGLLSDEGLPSQRVIKSGPDTAGAMQAITQYDHVRHLVKDADWAYNEQPREGIAMIGDRDKVHTVNSTRQALTFDSELPKVGDTYMGGPRRILPRTGAIAPNNDQMDTALQGHRVSAINQDRSMKSNGLRAPQETISQKRTDRKKAVFAKRKRILAMYGIEIGDENFENIAVTDANKSTGMFDRMPPSTANLLADLKLQLKRKGSSGLNMLQRRFKAADESGNHQLEFDEFKRCVHDLVSSWSVEEVQELFEFFDADGSGGITFNEFMCGLRDEMPPQRANLVMQAFQKLDSDGSGYVDVEELLDKYDVSHHPEVEAGLRTKTDMVRGFLDQFNTGEKDEFIMADEFIKYYTNISADIPDDEFFELMIRNCWHISGGEGAAANTSCQRVQVVHADGRQTVEEITDDLAIKRGDANAVVKDLRDSGHNPVAVIMYAGGDAVNVR